MGYGGTRYEPVNDGIADSDFLKCNKKLHLQLPLRLPVLVKASANHCNIRYLDLGNLVELSLQL